MPIGLKLTRDDVSPALSRMAATAKNPLPVYRAMGTTFKSITEGTFSSLGAEYRAAPWPAKKDGGPSILQKSTTMVKAFHLEVTNTYARLSNPMIYAAIHQFGGTIKANGAKALSWINAAGQRVFAKSVYIPPRPFYPVRDGRLISKAEEKIAAAGRRAMERAAVGRR